MSRLAFHDPSPQSARSATRPEPYTAGSRTTTLTPDPMRPRRLPVASLNQRFPSGPAAMPVVDPLMPVTKSTATPAVVILPMCDAADCENHKLPSGPAAMSVGAEDAFTKNSVTVL